jgi:hypothetical protein
MPSAITNSGSYRIRIFQYVDLGKISNMGRG